MISPKRRPRVLDDEHLPMEEGSTNLELDLDGGEVEDEVLS